MGLVFLSEGIQKFLFPELVGAGRFEKIGFTNPEFLAAFVASFEIICGVLMLIGFSVRVVCNTSINNNDDCNHNNQDSDFA